MVKSIQEQILQELDKLPPQKQRVALYFVRALVGESPIGVSADELMDLAGSLDPEDARQMRDAVEAGCEQVDPDSWNIQLP